MWLFHFTKQPFQSGGFMKFYYLSLWVVMWRMPFLNDNYQLLKLLFISLYIFEVSQFLIRSCLSSCGWATVWSFWSWSCPSGPLDLVGQIFPLQVWAANPGRFIILQTFFTFTYFLLVHKISLVWQPIQHN